MLTQIATPRPLGVSCRQCGYTVSQVHRNQESGTSGWMTTTEAARYLQTKARTLLLWVRQGHIKAYPLSGVRRRVWRFRREDLDAGLLSRSVVNSSSPTVL